MYFWNYRGFCFNSNYTLYRMGVKMTHGQVFDKYIKAKELGFTEEQARFQAISLAECQELHPEAVTKSDLETMRIATKLDLESMRRATKDDVEHLKIMMKQEIDVSIEKLLAKLESRFSLIDSKFVVMTTLGSFIFLVCCIPYVKSLLGH